MDERWGLLRRRLLAGAILVSSHDAIAQERAKMTQEAAQYQPTPRSGLSCIGCTFFRGPCSCQIVEGDISPKGWCKLFDMPD